MNEKYLPIGTICTLKGNNKKTIIIGYFSIEYKGLVTMYDYCGLDYPEGLLLNKKYSFNHSDIKEINYLGYVSDEFDILNKKMIDQQSKENKIDTKTNSFFRNIKFDENGVVIMDEIVMNNNTVEPEINNDSIDNSNTENEKIEKDNIFSSNVSEPSHIIENSNNSKNWSIFKTLKFDENGVIIEAEQYSQEELEEMKKSE